MARVPGRSVLVAVVALVGAVGPPSAAWSAPADIVVVNAAGSPSAPALLAACGLTGGKQQRQYFEPVGGSNSYPTNFKHRIGGRYPKTTSQTINGPIPPGTYDLVMGTYDSHHPANPRDVVEQWHAEFFNGTTRVAPATRRTPDLPTKLKAASWKMGQITLSASANLIRAVHDPSDGSNHGFVPWFVEFQCPVA
jgi:hypothetical protein